MAVPFIQIGQCGNQIGQAFFNTMHEEAARASPAHQALVSQFFYEGSIAKAMLVDMEPKVVNKCLAKKGSWGYSSQLSLVKEEGSGNNWAYGCHVHGPSVREDLEKLLKKVVEQEDYVNCFVQLQSLAGGTGSGVGTYVLSLLE